MLHSKATRGPLWDVSGGAFESREKFQRRLDGEDHAEDRGRVRLRPKNRFGAKKYGIEVTYSSPSYKETWHQYYRTERARRSGLAYYNGPKNRALEVLGCESRYAATAIVAAQNGNEVKG